MKTKTTLTRRVLALFMSVLMLMMAWVFVAPTKADAATAGSYKWRVYVNSRNNTGGWDAETLKVFGKPNNGTGSEATLLTVNNWKIDFKGTRDNTFGKGDQTTSQFPTRFTYYYKFGGGVTHRKLDADIYLQLYYNGSWNTIAGGTVYSYEWGKNEGTKEFKVSSDKLPKASSVSEITGGSSSVSVPTDGTSTNYTSAFTTGTVKDQYGVNWYQDATLSVSSHTGVSMSSNKVAVNSSANDKNNYTVTVTETCGSATGTKTVTVNVFDYKVTFYDENGTTVLKATQTIDYGGSATAPSNPTKAADASKHYTFASWTGDGYTNLKTGKQTRTVKASYNGASHIPSGWKTNATQHWKECTVCGYITTAKANHTWNSGTVTTAPTCTTKGVKTYTCTVCGATKTEEIAVNSSAHDWNAPTYVWADNNSTCTATRVCKHDANHKETETVNTSSVITTNATCTAKGETTYTAMFENSAFAQQTKRVAEPDSIGHSFTNYVSNNDATCTEDGTKTAKCDRCDATDTITDEGSKLGHSFTNYVSNNDATCTEDGTKTAKCDRCDATDTITDEGSKLGHSFTNYVSNNDATCTEDGTKTAKCDRCDATDTITDEGSKLGHSFTNYVSNNDATCTKDGTKTAKCDRCDATDTITDEGSKLGHSFTNYVSNNDATCTEDGTKTAKCDRCDATDTIADEGSKLGHSFTNYVSNNDATCTKDGTKTAKCDRCDATDTVTDAGTATGHDWQFDSFAWAEDSKTAKVNLVCGNDANHTKQVDATMSDAFTKATCEDDAYTVYTATYGDHTESKTITDAGTAIDHDWQFVSFEWAEDNKTAKVNLVCGNDANHTKQIDADMSDVFTAATCEDDAYTVYTATYGDHTDSKTVTDEGSAKDHDWQFVSFVWAEDNKTAKVNLVCGNNANHTKQVDATMSDAFTAATCEDDAYTVYTAIYGDHTESKTITDEGTATDHNWQFDSFAWAEDNKTAKVNLVCGNDANHTKQVDATMSDAFTAATCEDDAYIVYTATYGDHTDSKTITDAGTAINHDWQFVSFAWEADNKTAKVNLVCGNDANHTKQVDATMSDAFTAATCEDDAYTVYTATYGDHTESKTITDEGTATDHDWQFDSFAWAEDNKTAKVNLVCGNDVNHTKQVDATMSDAFTAATCEDDAYTVYTATYGDHTESKTITDADTATGHDYKLTGWAWAEDHSSATATFTCENDDSHVETVVDSAPTMATVSEQDCENAYVVKYTATVTFEGETYNDTTDEVTLAEALGHDYKAVVTDPTCTAQGYTTHTCTRCGDSYVDAYVDALGHDLTFVRGTVTCVHEGTPNYYKCGRCGKMYLNEDGTDEITNPDEMTVPKLRHDYSGVMRNDNDHVTHSFMCVNGCGQFSNKQNHTFDQKVEAREYLRENASCTEAGTYYYSCKCGEKGGTTFTVGEALGHDMKDVAAVAPTCTKEGNNAYRACTRCSYTEGYEYLPATGHGAYNQDASKSGQTEDGSLKWTAYSCSNGCGDYYMKLTVKALDGDGHPVSGASVKITDKSGKVNISGKTDANGTFSPNDSLKPGTYTFTLSNGKDKQTATITLSNGKFSGSIGKIGSGSSGSGSSSDSGSGSSSGSSGYRCPLCSWNDSMHNKPVVGVFVYVIHAILHFFFRLFNR